MKEAEEYINELYIIKDGESKSIHDSVENLLNIVKRIQIDTVEWTIRRLTTPVLKYQSILDVIDDVKKEIVWKKQ